MLYCNSVTISVLAMKIDLHTHSYYSDGMLSPAELLRRALAQKIDILALTDHDTTLGVEEIQQAAFNQPIRVVSGVEISCQWREQTIHMIGLNVDVNNVLLKKKLAEVRDMRRHRAENIMKKLTKFGVPGLEENVSRSVRDVYGRLHISRYLVEKGYAGSHGQAFKRFLSRGKVGYQPTQWMDLEEATALIRQANGISVIAHPRRYDFTMKKLTSLLDHFKSHGGDAVEVATTAQNKPDQQLVVGVAKQLDLALSIGSDFHEPCAYNELGKPSFLVNTEGLKFVADLL